MPTPLARITGQRGIWLLEMTVGGSVYRFCSASEAVTVTDAGSLTYLYEPGLSDFSSSTAFAVGSASVALNIQSGVDWPKLRARGIRVAGASCTVRRWFTGATLEEGWVLLRGTAEDIELADPGQPDALRLSVRGARLDDAGTIPPSVAVVDSTTHPSGRSAPTYTTEPEIQGSAYQVVFGYPGGLVANVNPVPVIPALMIEYVDSGNQDVSWLLVSDGKMDAGTVRAKVFPSGLAISLAITADVSVVETTDLLGRTFSYFALGATMGSTGGGLSRDEYYYGLRNDSTYGGGVKNLQTGNPYHGAGEIWQYVLDTYSTIAFDAGRFAAWADWLDSYRVDTYVNEFSNAWAWLQSAILPMLPVSILQSTDGIYLQPMRYDATAADAVAWLDADKGTVQQAGAIRDRPGDVVNEITVEYQQRTTGSYISRRIITADPGKLSNTFGATTDTRIFGDYRCKVSQQRYGVLPLLIQLQHTWDDATALRVAQDIVSQFALPLEGVQVVGPESLEALSVGDIVVYNNTAHSITNHVALIEDMQIGGGQTILDLTLLSNPTSVTIATT